MGRTRNPERNVATAETVVIQRAEEWADTWAEGCPRAIMVEAECRLADAVAVLKHERKAASDAER